MSHDPDQGTARTLRSRDPFEAQGARLVRVADLGDDQVAEVKTADHGVLAVGLADGVPFATGNVCRHQGAKLGRGRVREGCLVCPWHRAEYDVRTGEMVVGPQGRVFGFPPYSRAIKAWANSPVRLRTHAVHLADGWIVLGGG